MKFLFVLDHDKQGSDEKKRYEEEYGIPSDRIVTIHELRPGLKVIEDLFDSDALNIIQYASGSSHPKKGQILRFCQERLASDNTISLGAAFAKAAADMLDAIEGKLK